MVNLHKRSKLVNKGSGFVRISGSVDPSRRLRIDFVQHPGHPRRMLFRQFLAAQPRKAFCFVKGPNRSEFKWKPFRDVFLLGRLVHLDTITEFLNIPNHKAVVEVTMDRYQNIYVTFLVRDPSEFEHGSSRETMVDESDATIFC